jgi:hypothetical protein
LTCIFISANIILLDRSLTIKYGDTQMAKWLVRYGKTYNSLKYSAYIEADTYEQAVAKRKQSDEAIRMIIGGPSLVYAKQPG